jgi:hypothetical protein
MSGNPLQVTARAASARQDAVVVVTPQKGSAVALSADEARDVSRRLLSAAIEVERGERASAAKSKAREIRRAAAVDEQLREREG